MSQPPRQVKYYPSHGIAAAAFDFKIVFFKHETNKKCHSLLRVIKEYAFEGDFKSRNNVENKILFRVGKHSLGILIVKERQYLLD
jgi:hypothetical protein